jgi:hypothetical protein
LCRDSRITRVTLVEHDVYKAHRIERHRVGGLGNVESLPELQSIADFAKRPANSGFVLLRISRERMIKLVKFAQTQIEEVMLGSNGMVPNGFRAGGAIQKASVAG